MEQYFQDNRTYAPPTAGCTTDSTTSQYFSFTSCNGGAETRTATAYTLYAMGKGAMAGFVFQIDQAGVKKSTVTGVSGWSGSDTCWVTKQGGQC